MPLDDRIRLLSETILEEVRGPIEGALQNVLAEVVKLAGDDRDEAVKTAVAAAAERHQDEVARLSAVIADAEQAQQQAAQAQLHAEQAHQRAEQEQHRAEVEGAKTRQALEEALAEALDARQAAEAAQQKLDEAHAAGREHEMACTDRVLAAFRQLDTARSLTEVLNMLADHASAETGRAAVFVVAGSRLRGWVLRGLGTVEPASIDVAIEPYTVFGLALAQGEAISTAEAPVGADGDPLSTLFAVPSGSAGLAIPISVGGRHVAILYADDAGEQEPVVPSNWPEVVEILARHAARCLEVLTLSRGAVPETNGRNGADHAAEKKRQAEAAAADLHNWLPASAPDEDD